MDTFYLAIVIILFILAISDLIVGVSNDAVNFLNSAIGSKAASFRTIMIIAAVGILVGATFSSGLMEVARKGIFHPEQFYFSEIMIIFLAVMMTDILLLDVFNTFGLPTSTTVSIVFELLGSAVGISIIKIHRLGESIQDLSKYINSDKALAIISGILLSVVIAFTVGAIIQYLTRIIFSFNIKKTSKYFGSLWGGFALTAITYFMIIKGARGASFITEESLAWISTHTFYILAISFIGWTILLQLLYMLFKFNSLRFTVLVGTFALAMAFAGNDLVNFIGVPLAGLKSFQIFMADAAHNPDGLVMTALAGTTKSNTLILLLAGLVMVITLWTSRKARSVVDTTINLSRQDEGSERFSSTGLSRAIVRFFYNFSKKFSNIVPKSLHNKIENRFELQKQAVAVDEGISFDMLRASVNLVIASILIAFGTSLKLPLSTTYVTFMVAMGTSLADRAWGRDSAVYRITGVFSVIGGWFLTALCAFTVSLLIAFFIYFGGIFAIICMIVVSVYLIIRTHKIHLKKREKEEKDKEKELKRNEIITGETVFENCTESVLKVLNSIESIYVKLIDNLADESLKGLRKSLKKINELNEETKKLKDNVHITIYHLREDSIETGHYYVQVVDYLREIAHSITFIGQPAFEHINNNHQGLYDFQKTELDELVKQINTLISKSAFIIEEKQFEQLDELIEEQQSLLKYIESVRKKQIKRIKKEGLSTRNSLLYLNILSESKNLALFLINLAKSERDFINYNNSNNH